MNEVLTKTLKLTKDQEIQATVIVTVGSLCGSFFSYLLQFCLGRFLTVTEYGTFNALLSLAYLVSVPAGVFSTSLVKIVSELLARNDFKRLTALFWKVSLFSFVVGLFLTTLFIAFRSFLSVWLGIGNLSVIIAFGVFMSTTMISVVSPAYLQGLLRFRAMTFWNTVSSFLRFVIPIVLLVLGYGLNGVMGGMTVAALLAFILSVRLLRRNFEKWEGVDLAAEYKRMLFFALPIVYINFGMMSFNNIDMVLVKKFFSPEEAGYYAGVVTLGKILLFGAISVVLVMFPKVSALYARKENFKLIFKQLYLLQLFLVMAGVAGFVALPRLITTVFFGSRFLNSVEYLPLFSLFVALYVLVNFLVMFFLAVEKVKVSYFLIPAFFAQLILIGMFHTSLYVVIYSNIVVMSALFLALNAYLKVCWSRL